jgi:hypothetical protein
MTNTRKITIATDSKLLFDVKRLCTLIGNTSFRTVTRDIEDLARKIQYHPDVIKGFEETLQGAKDEH